MKKQKQNRDTTDVFFRVKELMEENSELQANRADYESKTVQYDAEKLRFIRTANLEDEDQFKAMSTTALKLDVCRNKIVQIDERIIDLEKELRAELGAVLPKLSQTVREKMETVTAKVVEQLRDEFPDIAQATEIAQQSKSVQSIQSVWCFMGQQWNRVTEAVNHGENEWMFIIHIAEDVMSAWDEFKKSYPQPVEAAPGNN